MTERQVAGFAVFCALLLGFAFFYWLAPILDYRAPHWVFYVCGPLIALGWETILMDIALTSPVLRTHRKKANCKKRNKSL